MPSGGFETFVTRDSLSESMSGDTETDRAHPNPFADLLDAVRDRHGQIELELDRVSLKLPLLPDPVEVSGTVIVSMHVRDLSEKEKNAHVARRVRRLSE